MKKSKKIISFVMAFMVTALPLSAELSPLTGNSIDFEENMTEDGFLWQKTSSGGVEIISYEGTDPDVVVPDIIEGRWVRSLPDRLFADNQIIKSVDLSQCYSFGVGLFENSSVESVILPEDTFYIPNDTFKNCKNLKHVEFGDDIYLIPESAFEGTDYVIPDELTDKYLDSANGYLTDDGFQYNIYNNPSTGKYIYLHKYIGYSTNPNIPESIDNIPVTYISKSAFDNASHLVYPKSVKSFLGLDMEYPEILKRLTFTSDVIHINHGSNMSEFSINEMTFPLVNYANTNSHVLVNGFFKDSQTIENVHFEKGEGNFKIESHAFENCSALDTVTFNGYSSIYLECYAFNNSALRRLELNANCIIDDDVFKDCNNLQEIVFNGDVNSSADVFKDCPLNNIIFGNTSDSVSPGAFNMCTSLNNINSEPAFDSSTGDFNEKYKNFIIRNFGDADDVGFVNEYVMWHVKDIVSKYTNDSMSDMEKAKVLHDWVCENVASSQNSGDEKHNDLSPFLTGVTVCDGYARSYNLLLHEAGIETMLVTSPDHIWNVIKIGGHYFHVDTTWDDGDKYTHNWFLKSDNETKSETSSHSQWTLKTASSLHDFQSDVLPECAYSMGDCNMDGSLSVADIVKMNKYIMGAEAVDSDDLVLYDLDFNGYVDVFDMIAMRQKIIGNTDIKDIFTLKEWLLGRTEQISPEFDMNGDGIVDVFDMIILRQNLS